MFELKAITREGIPKALEKAERYRLLNEPWQAESICLDVLRIDPENQDALVMLLLALTDQFDVRLAEGAKRAREVLPRLHSDYDQAYYAGVICERQARAQLRKGDPASGVIAFHWLREAMSLFEKAEPIRPPGNDDAVIRWNTCARVIMQNQKLVRESEERIEPLME
jgi:hypothetical protein